MKLYILIYGTLVIIFYNILQYMHNDHILINIKYIFSNKITT